MSSLASRANVSSLFVIDNRKDSKIKYSCFRIFNVKILCIVPYESVALALAINNIKRIQTKTTNNYQKPTHKEW